MFPRGLQTLPAAGWRAQAGKWVRVWSNEVVQEQGKDPIRSGADFDGLPPGFCGRRGSLCVLSWSHLHP